jgi:hypothetical protein
VLARPTTLGSYDAMMAKLKMQLTRPTAKPLLKFSNSVAKTTAQAKAVKTKSRAAILSTVKKVAISTTLPTTENNIYTDADATITSGSVDEGTWILIIFSFYLRVFCVQNFFSLAHQEFHFDTLVISG